MRILKSYGGLKDGVALAAIVLLAFAFLLGGASHENVLRVAALELVALPVLALALLRLWDGGIWTRNRLAVLILAAAATLPLAQSIPLPPAVWMALPGREQSVLGLQVAGLAPGWGHLSVTPDLTWRSFLAVLPPAALFLAVLGVSPDDRRRMVNALLILVLSGVVLALLQLAVGAPFYLWEQTTRGTLTGFLANRNHFATACLMALPFCGALVAAEARKGESGRHLMWLGALSAAVLLIALAAARSRFGVVMAVPVLGCAGLIAWLGTVRGKPGRTVTGLAVAATVALGVIVGMGTVPIMDRFDTAGAPEARFERWPTVSEVAQEGLPLGWGYGSFDRVYRSVEPPEEVDETYLNRAHNDYLETWLEGGWLSAAVLLAFLIWLTRTSLVVWRGSGSGADLARAGTVGIGIVLIHSAVDYPMRTLTIACLFAVCAALVEVSVRGQSGHQDARR